MIAQPKNLANFAARIFVVRRQRDLSSSAHPNSVVVDLSGLGTEATSEHNASRSNSRIVSTLRSFLEANVSHSDAVGSLR